MVTGAASGVGRYAAAQLAARGARVAAIDIDEDGLRTLATISPLITPFVCDVGDEAAARRAVQGARTAVGPFGQVVHCAGIAPLGRVLEQCTADFERAMRVNYLGTVHVARAAVPVLTETGGGSFIAIASIAGWIPLSCCQLEVPGQRAGVIGPPGTRAGRGRESAEKIVCQHG
ncbi:SDR family NAD(P)-dependent oxidoreductase [Streptomyces sp. NPDC059355]|uniref:SDR family NAD(P)-dependent oxidoreductase n=1 Tax=Streptomyces sp. NPDC059355 TaxID=3346811 RepID=UPI003680BCC2